MTRNVTTMCFYRVSWRQTLCRLNETLPTNGSHRFPGGWCQLLGRSRRRRASVQESAELTFGTLSAGWGASRAAGKNSIGIYNNTTIDLCYCILCFQAWCRMWRKKVQENQEDCNWRGSSWFWFVLQDDKLLGENIKRATPHILSFFWLIILEFVTWFILFILLPKCFVSTAYTLTSENNKNGALGLIKQKVVSLWNNRFSIEKSLIIL